MQALNEDEFIRKDIHILENDATDGNGTNQTNNMTKSFFFFNSGSPHCQRANDFFKFNFWDT